MTENSLARYYGSRRTQEKGLVDQTQEVSKYGTLQMSVWIGLLVSLGYHY
jgi:hypothetical protein